MLQANPIGRGDTCLLTDKPHHQDVLRFLGADKDPLARWFRTWRPIIVQQVLFADDVAGVEIDEEARLFAG